MKLPAYIGLRGFRVWVEAGPGRTIQRLSSQSTLQHARSQPFRTFKTRATRPSNDTFRARWQFSITSFPRNIQSRILRRLQQFRTYSTPPRLDPTPNLGSPEPSLSLSQRLRKLSREYGWSALGVYMTLSALDFPFCFLAVRTLGTDRIGQWEHVVVEAVKKVVMYPVSETASVQKAGAGDGEVYGVPVDGHGDSSSGGGWGVEEADKANKSGATLATQLALAYAIHKSFIFVRVPLTAAVTPKVVKVLRGWGWDIGKRKPKVPGTTKKSD